MPGVTADAGTLYGFLHGPQPLLLPGAGLLWSVLLWSVVGMMAVILEGMKGFIPVALAYWRYRVTGWAILPIMVAPLPGHMFSPFLRGHGGKGITVTFGVWMGLTVWRVPSPAS